MPPAVAAPRGGPGLCRPLHIVHGSAFYWPAVGGAEHQLQEISERLAARGHHVTVVTQQHRGVTDRPDPSLPTRAVVNGVEVHRLRPRAWPSAWLQRVLRVPGAWRVLSGWLGTPQLRALVDGPLLPAMRRHVVRARPDVVMGSNYYFPGVGYVLASATRRAGCPFVGLPLLHLEDAWPRSPTTVDLLRRTTALLVNTAYEARFAESVGVAASAITILGNGVDPTAFAGRRGAALRAAHGLECEPVVGYIGRLDPGKGVVTLIESMRRVWQAAPDARLLLAGRRYPTGSDGDRPIAAALAALSPAERQRVIAIGGFDDAEKPSLYDAIDVFAMPSTAESFGIAFLEAWICDRPVVAARTGAVECVIDHGVDGLLAPPGDAAATADAILALLADPDRRRRFAAAGRAKAESRFTWDRMADVVEGLYASLAGQPVTPAAR